MNLDRGQEPLDINLTGFSRKSPSTRYNNLSSGIPPSSSLRRSSTTDVSVNNYSIAPSLLNETNNYRQPYTNSLRRSSTHDPPPISFSRSNSLSRNESFNNGKQVDYPSSNISSSYAEIAPNYSRYSSLLDDKHDWGFRTLKRRNSKAGSKTFLNDDIKF